MKIHFRHKFLSPNSPIYKQGALTGSFRIIGIFLSYIFTLIISRKYGAAVLGNYTLSFSVLNILSTLALLGNDRAIIKFATMPNKQNRDSLIKNSLFLILVSTTALAIVFFFLAKPIATYIFKKEELVPLLKVFSIASIFYSFNILTSEILRGLNKMSLFSFYKFSLFYLLAIIFILIAPNLLVLDNSIMINSVFAVAVGISSIISFSSVYTRINLNSSIKQSILKKILTTSYPMLLASSMGLVMQWVATLILGAFESSSNVGVFNVSVKIAFFSSLLLMIVNIVITPKIARAYHYNSFNSIKNWSVRASKILLIGGIPVFGVLLIGRSFFLSVFGDEFVSGQYALIILLVGQFVSTYCGPVANILQMSGNEKKFMISAAISMVINIIINLVLIPKHGIVGAAVATSTSLITNNILCVIFVYFNLGFLPIYIPNFMKRV